MTIHDPAATEQPPVEPSAPVPETPQEPLEPVETESIEDHASQFGPKREPANTGQFANKAPDKPHKAQSQRATPEDVQEINRLTRELRETEQRLADKDPDAKASPRIRTLKRQIAALKALETPATTVKESTPPAAAHPAFTAPTEFSEPKPKIEQFQDQEDPLDAYMLALARWDRKRERFEDGQAQATAAYEAADRAAWDRIEAFAKTTPDYWQVTAAFADRQLPAVLFQAIKGHDKGAAFVYHLAQHPELADALIFETDGKPLTDAHVAYVQRRLSAALGPAAQGPDRPPVTPHYIPPKPPNPVRTGPIKTADEPPDEAGSIAEHAKYFGKKR